MKYKYFSHMADAKFRAYGKNLEESFKNAAYAMTDIITDIKKIKPKIKGKISIKSEDEKSLLYDFLEKFLVLLDTKHFLLSKIIILTINREKKGYSLISSFMGDNKPENYQIKTSIKAVTYQEMFIRREKGRIIVQVIVDI